MSRESFPPVPGGKPAFPVAIVGIGCRFPGAADDVESFWKLLAEGGSGVREVPPDRWNPDRFYDPDPSVPGMSITKWGGFLSNLDQFDARFWGLSPREAMRMDPQQRWLLETAWEALEDSGTAPQRIRGAHVGVFVGLASNDYASLQMPNHDQIDVHTNSGSTASIAANRISYLLDLKGPSAVVDTACSSSLVAVWIACQSLWTGCCTAALAGGVNALILQHGTIGFSKAAMVSPSGQCFAFDARANGYVRGEGAGVVFLKPLAQALADRDRIYAVIRSAVVNQDGHTSSLTVPGVEGQSAMLRLAYAAADLPPRRVMYIEAHGTGTPVGDPIEATALGRVLGEGRPPGQRCLLGSVKTNIGHLEAGSGIAGLIKAALVLHKDVVPPNRNFERPNPYIAFDTLRLEVASRLQPLPHLDGLPPLAAVNSFGFGGTNAHVVLEAAPSAEQTTSSGQRAGAKGLSGEPTGDLRSGVAAGSETRAEQASLRPWLLPISARDDTALRRYVEAYSDVLADRSEALPDVCHTAGLRKEHHGHRLLVLGQDAAELRRRLQAWLREGQVDGIVQGRASASARQPVFVFTGQGAQWWGMGRQLLEREPLFRRVVDKIDAALRPLAAWSLIAELTRPPETSQIDRTDIAQPAMFALQVALAELWQAWGVQPAKVIGHSVGEVAAAYCAGVYSLADAVKIVFHRSRLQHGTGGHGRMLVVGVSAAEALRWLGADAARVQVAVINSPQLVTLAGDTEPLESLAARLAASGIFVRWLRIQYAFHTHQMEPIKDELLQVLADIRPHASRVPFISTVTGGPLAGERMDATYWWHNVRQPVLFGPSISSLVRAKDGLFLELGPHPALASPIRDCLAEQQATGAVFHSLRRESDETLEMLTNLAGLHVQGVPLDWAAVNPPPGRFVRLPRYPWSYESFWLESKELARDRLAGPVHPLLGVRIPADRPTWELKLHPRRLAYLNEHRFWNSVVFPAAGYAEIGIALARLLFPDEPHAVEGLEIRKALFLSDEQRLTVRTVWDPGEKTFSVSSARDNDEWELHAQGQLSRMPVAEPPPVDLRDLRGSLGDPVSHAAYYQEFADAGYQFGPNFQQLQNVWRVPGEALAEIVVPDAVAQTVPQYHVHPAVLDACLHVFKGVQAVPPGADPKDYFYLPQSIRRVHLYGAKPPTRLWAHAKLRHGDQQALVSDIRVYDDQGRRVADILGFRTDHVPQPRSGDDVDDCYYQFHWEPCRLRGRGVAGPCPFPPIAEIVATAQARAPELHQQHALDKYHREFAPRHEALVAQVIQNAYLKLGWQPQIGERFTCDELIQRLAIAGDHSRLARAQLHALAKHGLLQAAGEDCWEVIQLPRSADVAAPLEQLAAEYPRVGFEIVLHQRTSLHLAEVLSGRIDPLDLLFPDGSLDDLERFYVEGGDFPVQHELIRTAIAKAIASLPPRRALRVLEVGAGTGSLTRVLLPALPADRTEYVFTDVGPAFLAAAKRRFAEYPFVEFQTFDVEQAPAGQGVPAGGFDLVLATDVLHATADLRQTLANLASCLADGGLLMFLELLPRRHAWDNLFGLLPGWWKFRDLPLRSHSPLLDRGPWLTLLADCGFRDGAAFSTSQDDAEAEQAVFLARAPAAAVDGPGTHADAAPARQAGPARQYVVLADQRGVADAVIAQLRERGHGVACVRQGSEYRRENDAEFVVSPTSEADLRRVFETLATKALAGVVHCWSLDHPRADALGTDTLRETQQTGATSALRLLHALPAAPPPRLWFATRDVHRVSDGDRSTGLASAPLVGLLRVAGNEYPQCRFRLVDLAIARGADEVDDLVHEITAGDDEGEVAYRGGRRFALRFRRVRIEDLPRRTYNAVQPDGEPIPFRLETDRPGILSNLALHETRRRAPGPDEIEVRVRAGGVNFRDVMKALGTYPGNTVDRLWFGDDFAGTVVRVGENVRHLRPGDEVAGMAPYAFRAYTTIDARLVFQKPPHMSWEQAATLPTVFLTAHYALGHLARFQPGESILIHGATGGVGHAAIQIAQRLGLEIFATAGTPEKRRLLTEMGVPHVMNSRTLEFADQVLEITGGRGVDGVLNSLAGDFIPKSLSVLAPFGRFLEIGKIDVYKNTKLGLQRLKDNISYFIIDLAQHLQQKPSRVAAMLAELSERFAAGDYHPLPTTVFSIADAAEAFRFMAQGKHVGKNVLSFDGPEIPIGPCTEDAHRWRADATYLVVGGAGGFGLEVAKWLARHGARHLVLMSRNGPRDDAARQDIAHLRATGITAVKARGDVTDLADVRRVVQQIADELPPLKGVVHAAMVLDDEFLAVLDEPRFNTALLPKMLGAWNLHVATQDLPLEQFLLFSSFSAVFGAPKQANYNAGNFFLDALAQHRRAAGRPALTIEWGPLSGAGFVERNRKTAEYLEKIGAKPLSTAEALRAFGALLLRDPVQTMAARIDWRALTKVAATLAKSPTFAAVVRERQESAAGGALLARLAAVSPDLRRGLIEDFIAAQVAGVFGLAEGQVDRETPLSNLGLDSLMVIELTNRLERGLGMTIPTGSLLSGPTIRTLADTLLRTLTPPAGAAESLAAPADTAAVAWMRPEPATGPAAATTDPTPATTAASAAADTALTDIDHLSDADVEELLSGMLNG
jgi:acyl transferase domain-containing protein/acyl carrier protein/predicted O-methyltransferase YrrM